MAMQPQPFIWFNGDWVPWDDAKTHVVTHTLHYGVGAFEGIRCYPGDAGSSFVFRLPDHIRRLFGSCRICQLPLQFSAQTLEEACVQLVRKNGMSEAYLRPIAFLGPESLGIGSKDNQVHVAIIAWVWKTGIAEGGTSRGIRAKISSFTRGGLNTMLAKGKICGQYVTSVLARREAALGGYDEALFLDATGHIAEATGENIFMVRQGKVCTPPRSSAILEGITRDTVMQLAKDLGLDVQEAFLTRDELYLADEVFLTGTAAEITPVCEVDNRPIGNAEPGPITRSIQGLFYDVVRGRKERYRNWLTPVL